MDADVVGGGNRGAKPGGGGPGKSGGKGMVTYIKLDMLMAGNMRSDSSRLVLVTQKVSDWTPLLYETVAPASLPHQQQRWQKRQQRILQRVHANELELQNKRNQPPQAQQDLHAQNEQAACSGRTVAPEGQGIKWHLAPEPIVPTPIKAEPDMFPAVAKTLAEISRSAMSASASAPSAAT